MKSVNGLCVTICCVCIAVSILSALIPQKRTVKIMSFAIGLFIISSVLTAAAGIEIPNIDISDTEKYNVRDYGEKDYNDEAVQLTADNLVQALNEILLSEGISAEDIRLSLKISDDGRIYASHVVIYINKAYLSRVNDIKSIVYGNLSKEPEIYVTGQEAE